MLKDRQKLFGYPNKTRAGGFLRAKPSGLAVALRVAPDAKIGLWPHNGLVSLRREPHIARYWVFA